MNILYITKLTGNPWDGTTYCVPYQIHAQSKLDNVMWLNLSHVQKDEWNKESYFFKSNDSAEPQISQLPSPFNKPDLVVVQQFYCYPFSSIIRKLQGMKIPYIIQPHGEMNKSAQKQKRIKKIIGNLLWFNKMIKRSFAIEYLTDNELKNTAWPQKKSLVIPNGITLPDFFRQKRPLEGINATFIGRLRIYHKGLDVLLDGIFLVKDKLKEEKFKLNIYGHDKDGNKERIQKIVLEKQLQDIVSVNDGIYGEDKEHVLKKTDLFVLTSRFEGHPIALLEALSYGTPSLVTPGTNMDKMVSQFDAGWCTEFDATAISKVLLKIVKSKNEWANKSVNARNLASVYSWDAIAQKAHAEYEQLLKSKDS
ncbi:glycosyltransferase [Fibrobacter sp. UWB7]|uniref:glycosyltransferase n=1 Tax=Fibrobacter sp. UWB7 TaxID=1896206 RepID=UPI00091216D3|nr:glycosyltransferase [Fibrobacter sp. UWB7]SHL93789.1 Glycosyltransferase involved in cell wall bisynthesis [Fibrobacter sp. UWB7]